MNREINELKNEIVKKKIFTLKYGKEKTIHYNRVNFCYFKWKNHIGYHIVFFCSIY